MGALLFLPTSNLCVRLEAAAGQVRDDVLAVGLEGMSFTIQIGARPVIQPYDCGNDLC